jgi:hypothetical protein
MNVIAKTLAVVINSFVLRNIMSEEELLARRKMTTTPHEIEPTVIEDPQFAEHLESLNAATPPGFDSSLEASYAEAARIRDSYRRWLFAQLDKADEETDTSFLESEIERLQSADDSGINRWGTREEAGDIEYGIVTEESTLEVLGDTHSDELGFHEQERQMETATGLCQIVELTFAKKADAQRFVDTTREAYFKKGDHSRKIIETRIDKGKAEPYVAVVLEAELNWDHQKRTAAERDRHLSNALRRIATATTCQELNEHVRICKRYSRDMQVLNTSKTFDGNRKVGIGWDYKRFATAMNGIADRAQELGLKGFRRYTIKQFDSTRKVVDGDMLDVGCAQGEFLAHEQIDESAGSLWEQFEGYARVPHSPPRLTWYNPEYAFGPVALRRSKGFAKAA